MGREGLLTTSKTITKLNEQKKPNYQKEDIILERKTTDPEILKKILEIEKNIIKRAKQLGFM